MLRTSWIAALIAVCLVAGCKAQTPYSAPAGDLNRRVEVMVRSQFNVPQNYDVSVGQPVASNIPGYQKLPVTLSLGEHKTTVDFLLSSDNQTLARLETFDLAHDLSLNIPIVGRPVRGDAKAVVTIVNYDDLECPYCARMHETLFPATLEHYKGLVRVVYKDNPLVEIHPWAMHAAVNAGCLAQQSTDSYWAFVDYLHAHGDEVNGGEERSLAKSLDALNRIARQHGTLAKLDAAKLDACIATQDESQVRMAMKEAQTMRVDGAPALFVNGERISGALPQPMLWMVIDRALKAAGVTPPATQTPTPAVKSGN